MRLRAKKWLWQFPRPALVMGIVNVTPDSFSDGGKFLAPNAAVEHALQLQAQGADIVDIGGESTRPNAAPVSETEELRRVMPVIEQLAGRLKIPISIDTQKTAVAKAALAAGASLVNDIAADRQDTSLAKLVAESGAAYVIMHRQGTAQTMQINPVYKNVTREVGNFFTAELAFYQSCGVNLEQILLDVGIGFGKTLQHNLVLLKEMAVFAEFQRPLLLGVSRKSFIGKLLGVDTCDRLPAGLACACWAMAAGVQLIRTHDVAETVQAARMWEAIQMAHPGGTSGVN